MVPDKVAFCCYIYVDVGTFLYSKNWVSSCFEPNLESTIIGLYSKDPSKIATNITSFRVLAADTFVQWSNKDE